MQQTQLNQKQRDAFEKTLRDKLSEAQRALREREREAETVALEAIIKQGGAAELAANAIILSKQVSEVESELEELGFELDVRDGEVQLAYRAPAELKESYQELVNAQLVPEKQRIEAIEKMLRDAWSIGTLAEAKELVEALPLLVK